MDKPYKPVACDLIDQIEIWATYKKPVTIKYKDSEGKVKEITTLLKTWENDGSGEFLVAEGGLRVRLDEVLGIEGLPA